jgi:tRNA nucleotidyltransferase (CCA-adding enzyme)
MERIDQPSIDIKIGPKVFRYDDSKKFIDKNMKTSKIIWLGDDARLYSVIERRVKSLNDFFYNLTHAPKGGSGIAPGLIDDLTNTYEVYIGKDSFKIASSFPWLARELVKIVSSDKILIE